MVIMLGLIVLSFLFFNEVAATKALLPKIEAEMDKLRTPPSEIVSADGVVIQRLGSEYRDPIHNLSEVPKLVQNAIIAAEDRRFWKHSGVDFWALMRVAFTGAQAGHFGAGGSTLEMQLAKRLTSKGEHTFTRKLHDIALAYNISQELSKDEVLKLYLNQVFFGSGAYGIKAAAQIYFGKSLSQLTVAEAALLARCVRRPSDENPFRNLDRAIENRNVVLGEMLKEGMIPEDTYKRALEEKVHLNRNRRAGNSEPLIAPYFINHVRSELAARDDIHLDEGGYKVIVTLDTRVQRLAEQAVRETVTKYAGHRVNTAAFVLMNAKGEILAEVGGPDFRKNQYNIISQGKRQPGSGFKPFVYATAIAEKQMTPETHLSNIPFTYVDPQSGAKWTPKNSSKSESAPWYTMRSALASSINISAAHTILDVGVHNVAQLAHDAFGFKSELREFPSLALGASEVSPLEMAQAYSVFLLRGNRAVPHTIASIEDPAQDQTTGGDGYVVHNVISPEVCDQVDSMLRSVVTSGTGTAAMIVPEARGKTGTTNDNKDAWFSGYANGLIGVGWVGHQVYVAATKSYAITPMTSSTFGGTVTAKMWAQIMVGLPKDVIDHAKETLAANWNRPPAPDAPAAGPTTGPPTDPNEVKVSASDTGAGPDNSTLVPGLDGQPSPSGDTTGTTGVVPGQGTAGPTDPATNPDRTAPASTGGTPDVPPPPDPRFGTPLHPGGPRTTPPDAPVRTAASRPAKPTETLVPVEICQESGLVANDYCPEVVTKYYRRSRVPKRACTIHHG
jgi:penicillin-binding protein 1A